MAVATAIFLNGWERGNFLELDKSFEAGKLQISRGSSDTFISVQVTGDDTYGSVRFYGSGFSLDALTLADLILKSPDGFVSKYEEVEEQSVANQIVFSPSIPVSVIAGLEQSLEKLTAVYSGDDTYVGAAVSSSSSDEYDWFHGYGGNDRFQGNGDAAENDVFWGGDGIDTAVYRGPRSNYRIIESSSLLDPVTGLSNIQGYRVVDNSGLDGTDQLVGVEFIEFSDVTLDLATLIPDEISQGVDYFNGSRYVIVPSSSWSEAQQIAVQLGGNLATISSEEEQQYIEINLAEGRRLWIGLNDADGNGVFTWVSGEPLTYTNWQRGFPNTSPYVLLQTANADQGGSFGTWDQFGNTHSSVQYALVEINQVEGTPRSDRIYGTDRSEKILGKDGRDTIESSLGNDTIDGGSGIDVVRSSAALSSVEFMRQDNQTIRINYSQKFDSLTDVERVSFASEWVALDVSGNAGLAAQTIVTAFGESQLDALLGLGISLVDSGFLASDLADLIISNNLMPSDSGEFIGRLYQNLFKRDPSEIEVNLIKGLLDDGTFTHATLLEFAANSQFAVEIVGRGLIDSVALPFSPSLI